jgi:PAS domain S-box-containing protein
MSAPQSPCERDAIQQGHTDGVPMTRAMGSAAHAAAAVPEPPQAGAALAKAVDDSQPSEAHLRHLLDTLPILASCHRPDGSNAFCNQRWHDYTGLSPEEAHGWGWTAPIHPEDLGKLMDTWSHLLASGEPHEEEARLRRVDGAYRWFLFRAVPVRDELGHIVNWYGTTTECRVVEEQSSDMLSSYLLLDAHGTHLRHGAAPRLPKSYIEAIDGVAIGPTGGSCITAAYRVAPVVVSDIAVDPLWAEYRHLPLAHGLRACWSAPIMSSEGQVLGTFAIYYREPRRPSLHDLYVLEQMASLAAVSITHQRAAERVRQDEQELRRIIDAIPQTIVVLGPDGRHLYANQAVLDYTGLTMDEVMAADFRARVFHPDDVERLHDDRQEALARGTPFANEQRARRHDGQYR